MNKSTEELFPSKPEALRIYAYSIDDEAHRGQLKVGQTIRDVKTRVAEQLQTAAIRNFTIEVNELAGRADGSTFSDHDVRRRLLEKGFSAGLGEWVRCGVDDVLTAIAEVRTGARLSGRHHQTFPMRAEQRAAVEKTHAYFHSIWAEDMHAVPRFLWNAKMRFGKTFTCYQLARKLGAKRVLVVTFKPAVEDAWQTDLESHQDFDGWQYVSKRTTEADPRRISRAKPLVYFGSFQDLLGRDRYGNIKARNEWLHEVKWDLVVFDEYHFGAWRDTAKELFEGEEPAYIREATASEYGADLDSVNVDLGELARPEADILPITTKAYLYLSGTPFKAMATGEFIEEQIFNWTYTDEQRAKAEFGQRAPMQPNPYAALPQMRLLTYQMPDELVVVANQGEFQEFDLNTFFEATGTGSTAQFTHESDVQKWLDIIRGSYLPNTLEHLKTGTRPPFPYSDARLLPYLQHGLWFLPTVAACHAMGNLLRAKHNTFWREYTIVVAAGTSAGVGLDALPPVRAAIGDGFQTKTITLSCGKLTTGVTVPQWSSILMLRNLKSPETYFQAAFRVQSPWSLWNPEGDDPNREEVLKPVCFVFDFAPTRALRQVSEYGIGLSPNVANPEDAVRDLVSYLPVLAYDGANMTQIDAGGILDIAMAGTSGTLLARKWESATLVNVDNETLRRIMENAAAMAAVERIEGWRDLADNILETIINKSEAVKDLKAIAKDRELTTAEKQELTAEEKEYKSKRKMVQEKLIKFATRIPPFMYLTDFRENTLQDVITKIEPELFQVVTGLTVPDFQLLVSLRVFNTEQMNNAVFAFRRYENASLRYTGIDSHEGLGYVGLYDTVVARETVEVRDQHDWEAAYLRVLQTDALLRAEVGDEILAEIAQSITSSVEAGAEVIDAAREILEEWGVNIELAQRAVERIVRTHNWEY
mgnify:CR=1 FL=1